MVEFAGKYCKLTVVQLSALAMFLVQKLRECQVEPASQKETLAITQRSTEHCRKAFSSLPLTKRVRPYRE